MSIDPLVGETDQPYVFTNDNPLNTEDPLGLGGGGTCDNTNVKKQNACIAAYRNEQKALDKACPSGYYDARGNCDPGIAKTLCHSYSNCAPTWPSVLIDAIAGALACGSGFGTAACIGGGLAIAAKNVGSDVENGCSSGRDLADVGIGIAGAGFGAITELGEAALAGAPAWMRGIYHGTTGAPSAGATALQSRSNSRC